jgi:toxin ParE1/3/4
VSYIARRSSANRDLVAIFRRYAREAGIQGADRFFTEAEATFERLARMPGIGARYEPDEPLYADIRYFPVARFRMFLVFYRPIAGGIEVLHVLHGAREIEGALKNEFGIEENNDDAAEGQAEPED